MPSSPQGEEQRLLGAHGPLRCCDPNEGLCVCVGPGLGWCSEGTSQPLPQLHPHSLPPRLHPHSSPPRLPLSHSCHSGGFSPAPPALCSMRLLEPFSPTEQPCAPPVVGPDASCRGAEPLPALSLPRRPPRFAQLRSAPFPSAADVGALPSLPHLGEEERRAGAAQPLRPRGALRVSFSSGSQRCGRGARCAAALRRC